MPAKLTTGNSDPEAFLSLTYLQSSYFRLLNRIAQLAVRRIPHIVIAAIIRNLIKLSLYVNASTNTITIGCTLQYGSYIDEFLNSVLNINMITVAAISAIRSFTQSGAVIALTISIPAAAAII